MKKHNSILSCLLLVGLMVSPIVSAETIHFLNPTAGDLVAVGLQAPAEGKMAGPAVSTESVTFSWALPADQQIEMRPATFHASSREYSLSVTAADLQSGVALPTTAPGALVRLNPAGAMLTGQTIDPISLALTDPAGTDHVGGEGMLNLADADAMKAAGTPFAEGTSAFRVDPKLGSGLFILRSTGSVANPSTRYAIHVFEKDSPVTLDATTDTTTYFVGAPFSADFNLFGNDVVIGSIEGRLVAPSGIAFPVTILHKNGTAFAATTTLKDAPHADQGLWEVHASIVGHGPSGEIRRDVHTAFAIATPTARLLGHAEVKSEAGLVIEIPVETAAPGRYEIRAILFGTDSSGILKPIGIGDTAAWMAQGVGSLALHFDGTILEESGLGAPYELHDLQLLDQGRMGQLHRQALALVVE